ncbi:MAG: flagellar biosynthesis protein FlhA [Parvularculaceae bacterium]
MSDAATNTGGSAVGGLIVGASSRGLLRGDVFFAAGILAIITMLILPTPRWLLDLFLAVSITFSVLVLMTALFIQRPLEFTTFPTVLLVATMLRLGLNIASTRLILSNGHEGPDAAGRVIEAFGAFVMQGNYVIGVIVFAILVLVNFIVITRGSSRIAEVAARFTLDAMPGKQMAIDADLSSGLINEDEARARRKRLEDESNFFGAMDGASKFVRGDAVAGLLITLINIIGGMVIGAAQMGMSLGDAAQSYTLLTIGDGLVSQIPALIISVAAGMLVSKAGVEGAADKALFSQFTNYPHALGVVSGALLVIALLPGMPLPPFLALSAGCGAAAFYLFRNNRVKAAEKSLAAEDEIGETKAADEPIASTLAMDDLRIELGYGLLPLINDVAGAKLTDQIKALRRQLAQEMGFVTPSVRILDNMQLEADEYVIRLKEMEAGRGGLKIGRLLVMDPRGGAIELEGEATTEPAFGLPAKWISENLRDEASFRGYTVVDSATVLTTHLTEIIKDNMAELLSYAETKKLLNDLPERHRGLVDDVIPSQISFTGVQRILQNLLKERVSIRDLPAVLEAIAEAAGQTQNVTMLTEFVRSKLSRQICAANRGPDGALAMVVLSPQWEQAFADSLIGEGEDRQLAMAPTQLHEFIQATAHAMEAAAANGDAAVLVTSAGVRPYIRSVIERFRPQTVVMSQAEIHPQAKLRTVGQI